MHSKGQQESIASLRHIKIQRLNQTATGNDMNFQRSRIVFDASKCLRYQRPGETCCNCVRMLQGLTVQVKKRAEQRSSSRFIMCVFGIHDSAFKKTQRGRRCGTSVDSRKLKRARDYKDSARYLEDEPAISNAHARPRKNSYRYGHI